MGGGWIRVKFVKTDDTWIPIRGEGLKRAVSVASYEVSNTNLQRVRVGGRWKGRRVGSRSCPSDDDDDVRVLTLA